MAENYAYASISDLVVVNDLALLYFRPVAVLETIMTFANTALPFPPFTQFLVRLRKGKKEDTRIIHEILHYLKYTQRY